jgi:hypothetical protein
MRISSGYRADRTDNRCAAVANCPGVRVGRSLTAASVPNRNGGRHCCQPPLRRAKDLPVSQISPRANPEELAHQLRRRFPSDCFLRRRSPTALPRCTGPKTRFRFDPSSLAKPEPSDVPRPFLGWPRSRPALLTVSPKAVRSRAARPKDHLFRRLFPAGTERSRGEPSNRLPAEIGPLVTCRIFIPLPACR